MGKKNKIKNKHKSKGESRNEKRVGGVECGFEIVERCLPREGRREKFWRERFENTPRDPRNLAYLTDSLLRSEIRRLGSDQDAGWEIAAVSLQGALKDLREWRGLQDRR